MSAEQVKTLRMYPFTRTSPLEPPPELAEVRQAEPVAKVQLWDGSTAWLATRYEDVRHTLLDPEISSDTTRPGFPQASATAVQFRKGQRVFVRMDAPKHDDHRPGELPVPQTFLDGGVDLGQPVGVHPDVPGRRLGQPGRRRLPGMTRPWAQQGTDERQENRGALHGESFGKFGGGRS